MKTGAKAVMGTLIGISFALMTAEFLQPGLALETLYEVVERIMSL